MNTNGFARSAISLRARRTVSFGRRALLQRAAVFAAVVLGRATLPDEAMAKTLCLKNGSQCAKKGKKCSGGNCLQVQAPFTIETRWTNPNSDHDAFLVVPNAPGASLPMPFLDYACTSAKTGAGGLHPFAFVNQDATGPGDEVTSVAFLLIGKYQFWVSIDTPAPAGEITVMLRNKNGGIIRSWTSPVNGDAARRGWHVFDIDGKRRSVASVDQSLNEPAFLDVFFPSTRLCL